MLLSEVIKKRGFVNKVSKLGLIIKPPVNDNKNEGSIFLYLINFNNPYFF